MDTLAWSGAAAIDYPDAVLDAHKDYIDAGAEAIITNTFGMSPFMLAATKYADLAEDGLRAAVRLAKRARDEAERPDVAIAGSISTMAAGGDIESRQPAPTPEVALEGFRLMTRVFVEEGLEAVALEMMEDTQRAPLAMQAAKESGLDVWLGVSCARQKGGEALTAFDFPETRFADVLDVLLPMEPDVVCVMHSDINVTPDGIEMVKERFKGPLGVYPESGYFTMPNWHFVDVIAPEDLVAEAKKWVAQGVRLIGGCCGLGPEHIRALVAARGEFQS
jgi:S-methylmethionine-dependent homocysteine/selenocysteine methylase